MIHAQNPHTIVLEPYLQNHFCKRHVPEAGFLSEIAPHVLFSSLLFHYLNKIPGSHPDGNLAIIILMIFKDAVIF